MFWNTNNYINTTNDSSGKSTYKYRDSNYPNLIFKLLRQHVCYLKNPQPINLFYIISVWTS